MDKKLSWVIISIIVILLAGCQATPSVEAEATPLVSAGEAEATPQPVEPTQAGQPETGKATVTGKVFSLKTNAPLANMVVRLAEVHREGERGAFLLDTAFSPGDITDEQGYFIFENVEPGEFVLVVGDVEVYKGYVIIPESSGKPRVYEFEADKIQDVGELTVDLGPAP
jgi:hypothetical protein